jgi:hypothetical protein
MSENGSDCDDSPINKLLSWKFKPLTDIYTESHLDFDDDESDIDQVRKHHEK